MWFKHRKLKEEEDTGIDLWEGRNTGRRQRREKIQFRAINRTVGRKELEETGGGMCAWIYSLLDIPDLHAGCAAAAGAHEGLRSQLRDLCTPCLNTQIHTNINSSVIVLNSGLRCSNSEINERREVKWF